MKKMIQLVGVLLFAMVLAGCDVVSKDRTAGVASSVGGGDDAPAQTVGAGSPDRFADDAATSKHALRSPVDQTYYFDFDQNTVKQAYVASIDAQANYLLSHPNGQVRLEGHTDERGSREYNVALGWRRAKAIARLMKQLGVSSKQLALVSYGKERPAAFGSNERAWKKNRRVRLIYEAR